MRHAFFVVISLVLSTTIIGGAVADGTCPALVVTALETTAELCSGTGRNQVCYGNAEILAQSRPGAENFTFETHGDIVDAVWIESMQLSPLDVSIGHWGVSFMRLQANLPDTLPGQNVTFLLFGDVEVQNRVPLPDLPVVSATANSTTNVRVGPSTSSPALSWLTSGDVVTVNGRLQDNSWLRLRSAAGALSGGWVYAPLLTLAGDASSVNVVDPTVIETVPGPMQAIYFKTGTGNLTCSEAPADGILIQTPHGAGRVELEINGVDVQLGSTVFAQAVQGQALELSTIEGSARIEALGEVQYSYPGTRVTVPLDESSLPAAPPARPVPYDEDTVRRLPYQLLDRPVHVYPAMSEAQIEWVLSQIEQGNEPCGWSPLPPCPQAPSASQSGPAPQNNDQSSGRSNDDGSGRRGGRRASNRDDRSGSDSR